MDKSKRKFYAVAPTPGELNAIARRRRCSGCGKQKPIVLVHHDGWHWCALCVERLEKARGLVLDDEERKRYNDAT